MEVEDTQHKGEPKEGAGGLSFMATPGGRGGLRVIARRGRSRWVALAGSSAKPFRSKVE